MLSNAVLAEADFTETVILTDDFSVIPVERLMYYKDADDISLGEVLAEHQNDFLLSKQRVLHTGLASNLNWVHITVRYASQQSRSKEIILRFHVTLFQKVELYKLDRRFAPATYAPGTYDERTLELDQHLQQHLHSRHIEYPLRLEPNVDYDIYVKLYSNGNSQIELDFLDLLNYQETVGISEIGFGLFIGFMLSMIVYNLIIYLSVKDNSYLLYVAYAICALTVAAGESGMGSLYIWPQKYVLNVFVLAGVGNAAIFSLGFFGRKFMELEKYSVKMDRNLKNQCLLLLYLWPFCIPILMTKAGGIYAAILMYTLTYVIVCAFYCWRLGSRTAGFYLASFFFLTLSAVIFCLQYLEVLDPTTLTRNGLYFGILIESLFLSIGLSDRVKEEKQKRLQAQQHLYDLQHAELEEKNLAEIHLKRSERLFRYLYENSLDCHFEADEYGVIVEANLTTAKMLGLDSVDDLLERHASIFYDLTLSPSTQQQLLERIQHGEINDFEFLIGTLSERTGSPASEQQAEQPSKQPSEQSSEQQAETDKRSLCGSLSLKPIYLETLLQGYRGSLRNITERKEKESVLLEKQAAQATTEAKSAFLATMSHEIRTPLTSIIGFAEALYDSSYESSYASAIDTAQIDHCVTVINRCGLHLLTVINDILDLAKIDANRLQITPREIDLIQLLNEIHQYFVQQAKDQGVDFAINYRFPLPYLIDNDGIRLKQILIHLCGNALKFTQEGSVTVHVSCDINAAVVLFAVADTGIGIRSEVQGRMFLPFEQADSSMSRNYGGTGLGLHISKQLAEKMGGDITLISTSGIGTTFTLSVGMGKVDARRFAIHEKEILDSRLDLDELLKQGLPDQVDLTALPKLQGCVLLAEDNVDTQQLIAHYLVQMGLDIVFADNGESAVEKGLSQTIDLILMDNYMPRMSGKAATEMLRSLGFSNPILGLTADVDTNLVMQLTTAGANECLPKPLNYEQLHGVLSKYLSTQDRTSTAVAQSLQQESMPGKSVDLNSEHIERAHLERVDHELQLLTENYKCRLPKMIAELADMINRNEYVAAAAMAHQLKGSAGSFGFHQITTCALEIEVKLKQSLFDEVEILVQKLVIVTNAL